jgi:hypothetical protein
MAQIGDRRTRRPTRPSRAPPGANNAPMPPAQQAGSGPAFGSNQV